MASESLWSRFLRSLGLHTPEPEPPRPAPAPAAEVPCTWQKYDDRIPSASLERVELIRTLVTDLEARAAEQNLLTEVTELDRLRTTHLPKLLESYVDIPAEHRAEVFRETGRSASFLLNERLDKMIARLGEISSMLARGQINAFRENMHFIDARYGSSPFD